MRAMAFGGMKMDDIDDEERSSARPRQGQMALRIFHVGQYGPQAAKKAGFQKDDILIEVGDLKQRMTESAIIGHLLRHHLPASNCPTPRYRRPARWKASGTEAATAVKLERTRPACCFSRPRGKPFEDKLSPVCSRRR
jgi:hypothetical protein